MRLAAPEGYLSFHCIADRCRHTCCQGWEIDIDPETMERYRHLRTPLGEALRTGIEENNEGAHFLLGDGERCPMLTGNNLCRVILEGGESLLCQICTDHPRFRSFFSGYTEIGLGLCCEEAARRILFGAEPLNLAILEDNGEEPELSEDEQWLLAYRKKLWEILLTEDQPLTLRLEKVLETSGTDWQGDSLADWADFLLTLEQLDPQWGVMLKRLAENPAVPEPESRFDAALTRLAWYLLYRHLPGALDDGLPGARAALCVLLTRLVRALFTLGEQTEERLTDLCRMMSSELEYSDENITALLEWIEPDPES